MNRPRPISPLNGAPVDSQAPCFDHLSTQDAIVASLENPAFKAKWGNVLSKTPGVAQAAVRLHKAGEASVAAPQGRTGTHSISAIGDGNFTPRGFAPAADPKAKTTPESRRIQSESRASTEEAAERAAQALNDVRAMREEGGHGAVGWEGTHEELRMAEQRGLLGESETSAADEMNTYLGGPEGFRGVKKDAMPAYANPNPVTTPGSSGSGEGFRGEKVGNFAEGKTEKARDIAPLVTNLAQKVARLKAAIARNGGIRRVPATVTGRQGVKGLRGQDAAQRKAMDSAKASDSAYLAAHEAMKAGLPNADISYPAYWDKTLGMFRPVRD